MQNVFIRWPEVQKATQISRSTAWRLEQAGQFPLRRKISANTVGWLQDEIESWVLSRSCVNSHVASSRLADFDGGLQHD